MRVSYDGSWQKRGHTSLIAVGAVVEAETGLVLDYETISKYCEKCTKKENAKKAKKITEKEYNEWYDKHKNECTRNYTGSSGGMEAAAAVAIFGRSVEKKLRYTVFISDGDSSAYDAICNMNEGKGPYGGIVIEKAECINHVSKRLGTALRKLRTQVVTVKTTQKGAQRRMSDMGGRGKLTDFVINKLTKYYGTAVRRQINGTVSEMRKEIMASLFHCSSSDAFPRHFFCPKSEDSWCFYERAVAKNEPVVSHKEIKVTFEHPDNLRSKVDGEYKRLTSDKLLTACLLGKTQNPNEHLHSRVWRYCSKYKNSNKHILDFASAQAVVDYNEGM